MFEPTRISPFTLPYSRAFLPVALAAVFLGVGLADRAGAAMGSAPVVPSSVEASAATQPAKPLARLQLATGAPILISSGRAWRGETGTALGDGDVLHVPEGARVRLLFNNGDTLHLGAGSLLEVAAADAGWHARMWQGAAAIYALPGGRGQGTLETWRGSLEAGEGKLGVVIAEAGGPVSLYAFNNWRAWEEQGRGYQVDAANRDWKVDARWQGSDGITPLRAGEMLRVTQTAKRQAVKPAFEVDFTTYTSPEAEAMRLALRAFVEGDRETARKRFEQVQQAFPKNAEAAYYLGLIALEANQNFTAIQHWQRYVQLDPATASKRGIPERLTLLVNQQFKDEIEQALKREGGLGEAKAEPGSVAVLPYINRGDAAHAILAKGLTALVVSDLAKIPGLKVLERAKLQKLLDELALSKGGLVEQQNALRAGRLMRAENLLIGDYKVEPLK